MQDDYGLSDFTDEDIEEYYREQTERVEFAATARRKPATIDYYRLGVHLASGDAA